jgi:3-hydroxyisobutyrate dehydrogenase-like beta-hydroxyacid dehydrogenase
MSKEAVGFIGIGIMGRGMALNLLKKGFKVVVWNRSVDKCSDLVKGLYIFVQIVIFML